jgi:hypothetical protein
MFWMTLFFIKTTSQIQDFANDENMTTATAVLVGEKNTSQLEWYPVMGHTPLTPARYVMMIHFVGVCVIYIYVYIYIYECKLFICMIDV